MHWGGEMGRLPVIQNEANIGRDHNTYGFTQWVAGGGFKPELWAQQMSLVIMRLKDRESL